MMFFTLVKDRVSPNGITWIMKVLACTFACLCLYLHVEIVLLSLYYYIHLDRRSDFLTVKTYLLTTECCKYCM
jgi:hypothetical protein